jgi:hypothetical protein
LSYGKIRLSKSGNLCIINKQTESVMVQKKEFMLLFRFEPTPHYQPSKAEMDEMHQQWGSFIGNIALQEKLVSTYQLGFCGVQIFADQTMREGIHLAEKQTLGGNMIVAVNTIQEATALAKNCPILKMGGTVEVRDIQPM